jgi:hypothetical protein
VVVSVRKDGRSVVSDCGGIVARLECRISLDAFRVSRGF